ncbi:Histone deacetylase-like amidohydrolase [Phycisphaerae bacterium RAS1]|nr:Histone deacetylase-like amidohydrolase [Phycisphaerae bacterium RAS1]
MSDVGLLIDDRFLEHDTGRGHPERPERLVAIRDALHQAGCTALCRPVEATPIDAHLLTQIHTRDYLERVQHACAAGAPFIDVPDSAICPRSDEIARLAAGGVVNAALQVASGRLRRAFCAVRPPGHHAERESSMGFCLFNNIALAAQALRREFGLSRILILDWDVHHGNGTQHIFEADADVMFVSLHGHPDFLYPGSGYATETGVGAGLGYTLNVPFMPGADDAECLRALRTLVLPAVHRFAPQFVLISAGFDAHGDDPLGNLRLSDHAFDELSRAMIEVADASAGGRLVSVLEGGYDLAALGRCTVGHVKALLTT